jgi:hypothetical protein
MLELSIGSRHWTRPTVTQGGFEYAVGSFEIVHSKAGARR